MPALLGGQPIRQEGPPDWPFPDEAVRDALAKTFRDGTWGKYHGGIVASLEARVAEQWQVDHAIACSSGTIAVELALRALKVGPGDEVLQAGYDYAGNFLSIHAVGALPVLMDLAPTNWNIEAPEIIASPGNKAKAIIVSHLHGGIAPIPTIVDWGRAHGIAVIEDAAQCPGGMVRGRPAGSWGDIGILSFGGSKLLTAGRGGALLTSRRDVFHRLKAIMSRGNAVAPLSELQAAVLLPQLDKLSDQNRVRAASVAWLERRLENVPGIRLFQNPPEAGEPGYYKLGIQVDPLAFGLPTLRISQAVRAEGIALETGFRALHRERSPSRFRAMGDLSEADRAHFRCLVLHHPVLLGTTADLEQVAAAIEKAHAYALELLD